MKRLLFVLFAVVIVGMLVAQSESEIADIKGRRANAPAIRTAFESVAAVINDGAPEFTGDVTLENDATITNPHADTVKVTDAVVQLNGAVGVGSAPSVTITDVSRPAVGVMIITIDGEDWMLFKASDSTSWKN